MSKYQDRAKEYHNTINRALLSEWDPIGVCGIPEAQDEYNSYVPEIYKMLISGKSKPELFAYLWWLETEHMGLTGDRQRTENFSERLLEISNELHRLS